MQKFLKSFGFSLAAVLAVNSAFAAESGRAAYNVSNVNAKNAGQSTARMPTMQIMPVNGVGSLGPTLPGTGGGTVTPPVVGACPDGGVRDSEYTVENCMDEVLACVNNGALPNGLNDLFNEDLRNSIFNGMGLCSVQVQKCVTDVRKNCAPLYNASADVWIDFNARRIQPEYFSFVLRKTGLTPNQAENTCWLLDKNTYGSSFNAVSNDGNVTSEYANGVTPYNGQGGSKANPQGMAVNNGNGGVDGQRGHYARWDAVTGTCLVRVAGYNKDEQIKNSWLFGALGDDKNAEVWKSAGESFSCNKDLFGFSLMNQTSTVAVVGIGGGTLVGAGTGAIIGHGKREFDCKNEAQVKELKEQLRPLTDSKTSNRIGILNKYLEGSSVQISAAGGDITREQCDAIVKLYDAYLQGKSVNKVDTTNTFHNLQKGVASGTEIICPSAGGDCISGTDFQAQITELDPAFRDLPILNGEKSNMLKSTAIGAGVGAAAGGLATAITAFVEKNNISCHVGDGLEKVSYGKSYSIGSLKDFYVKWNLRLPDTVLPTAKVSDCQSWKNACGSLKDLNQCAIAQLNYKPVAASATQLVSTACVVSGSVCIENNTVAKSYGACN